MLGEKAQEKLLIVIAGPTAVGKTDLCLQLAQELNTEIISADSRQFYKEMSIGTAKPINSELEKVKHYFINTHTVAAEYNAGEYENEALAVINNVFEKNITAILTGGSGLYIRAVTEGMDDMPEIGVGIREQLKQDLQSKGLVYLLNQLQRLDPVYYLQVDRDNTQRVIRALEVCISSGKPYSSFRGVNLNKHKRQFKILKICLYRDRDELYARIDARMDQMLRNGLLEEVKALYPYRNQNALQTVGYKELFDFLDGQYDWEEAVRLLKRNSRRYAKRQLTWFRKDKEYAWFHPDNAAEILRFIQQHLPGK